MATDPNLLIRAFRRHAARQPLPRVWLENLHASATAACAAGDEFVTSSALEGISSTFTRGIPSAELLAITEGCLAEMDAEAAGGAGDCSVRIGDFSGMRSEWG